MLNKILFSLLFLGMAALILVLGRVVIFNDYSTMRVSAKSNPDLVGDIGQRAGVYLISYAHGPEIFFKNQNALAASALNRGVDFIMNYRKSLLDETFLQKNKEILDKKKGAGYWLWKPQVIAQTLREVPEGSFLVYADTGFVMRQSIGPYLDKMGNKDIMLVDYDRAIDGTPIEIAKRDVFVRLQCDELSCWDGNHIWAAFVIVRNTPKGRAFVAQWLELCQDGQLLEDDPSLSPAHARQKKHHHDEAILSVLYNALKKEGADYIQLLPVKDMRNLMAWHHRHPGMEYYSTLPKSAYFNMRGVERKFVINASPLQKLREHFK
tara:strand:- start:947 stop:1912 length:966 start_codon:yes stop_codon:yes gene_type:complete